MVKRTTADPQTPKKKRVKLLSGQAVLDRYFGRSSQSQRQPGRGKGKEKVVDSEETVKDESLAASSHEQIGHLVALEGSLDVELTDGTLTQVIALSSDSEGDPSAPYDNTAHGPDVEGELVGARVEKDSIVQLDPQRKIKTAIGANLSTRGYDGERFHYNPVAVDPLVYPVDKDPWPTGTPAPYSFLVHALVTISETRSRIAILNALTNTLRCFLLHHPPSLIPALYLLSNSNSSPYSPVELGIGGSIISKAIQHVSGLSHAALRGLYALQGDPGDVAFEAKSRVRTLIPHPPLLITGVYDSLLKIAHVKGQGAAKQKQSIVERLLVTAEGEEVRYLVRTLSQNLRVGAVRTSILTALSRALVLTPPSTLTPLPSDSSPYHASARLLASVKQFPTDTRKTVRNEQHEKLLDKFSLAEALLKRVYVQHPNYDHIVAGIFEGGLDGLQERIPLTVGIPLHPTLGTPVRSLQEIYDRLDNLPFAAEFKYDGQRAQIHATRIVDDSPSVHIFSRHLETMTDKYPDVVSLVKTMFGLSLGLKSFIIDSEIVAIDPSTGNVKSFQELASRARKGVEIRDVRVSVCVFAFDLMYLDGEVLLDRPFRERRALLREKLQPYSPKEPSSARLRHVESCESARGREFIERFWRQAVENQYEGVMIKLLDSDDTEGGPPQSQGMPRQRRQLTSTYEPDKRTSVWLKLKKDYVEGLGDSLDLVPIGAYHGNGRKAGWWSPVLLAVWDPEKEKLVAVCKCMSGFPDKFYRALASRYQEGSDDCSRRPLWDCETGGFRPDVYFRPQEVWEVRGADITISPVSVAASGAGLRAKGLSLRFPRFIRVREDKHPWQATTTHCLARMFREQGKHVDGDDFDAVAVDSESDNPSEEEVDIDL